MINPPAKGCKTKECPNWAISTSEYCEECIGKLCKYCNGSGKQTILLERVENWVDKEGQHSKWADVVTCKWCLGNGKHIPLSQQEWI